MSLYARSDVMSVAIPPSSGGCGASHTRPVTRGVPSKIWELNCIPCAAYLSGARKAKVLKVTPGDLANGIAPKHERVADMDPHWSSSPEHVPPTPDEQRADTHFRKTAQMQIDMMNALGTAIGNGLTIPPEMMHFLRKGLPAETIQGIQGSVVCPNGHDSNPGVKFCSECGVSMNAQQAIEGAPEMDLGKLHVASLKKMAREAGLSDKGSKAELITRLEKVPA